MEASGPFAETENRKCFWPSYNRINYRTVVRCFAAIDIFYAMLLIGLYLLTLITGGTREIKQTQINDRGKILSNNNTGVLENSIGVNSSERKIRETLSVIIWVGNFAVCILQLLIASALYGGTKQREARICIRNCRIWIYACIFLMFLIVFKITGLCIQGKIQDYIFRASVFGVEFVFRFFGILATIILQKEIKEEISSDADVEATEDAIYYELQPTTPSPTRKATETPGSGIRRPSRFAYHRANREARDGLDFDEV